MEKERINDDLTYKIIGCAMRVHSFLGCGFQEIIYQRALAIELRHSGLCFTRELKIDVYYRDEIVGSRRVDFLVEENILIELKAVVQMEDVHLAQGLNYLEAFKLKKGLLLNFGAKSLEIKRLLKR
jgi:GxxExxY protein